MREFQALVVVAALSLSASIPVLAHEVLYCVDAESIGFKWETRDRGAVSKFLAERYTIKVLSDTERVITWMLGDTAVQADRYFCRRPSYSDADRIVCQDWTFSELWYFYQSTYTRAFLAGPPAGGEASSIWIAHGTCTKF
jgi:hypothetical protein